MTTETTILPLDDLFKRLDSFIEHNDVGTIFPENFFTSIRYKLRDMKAALEFYADEKKWNDETGDYTTDELYRDGGKRAKEAMQ